MTEGGEGETKNEDNEKKENDNTKTPDIKNIKYNIYFYLLEREKKDVLIDMIVYILKKLILKIVRIYQNYLHSLIKENIF